MTLTVFVTATDTGAGKTHVACEVLRMASAQGLRCAGFKPVAAGGDDTPEGLRNPDAVALLAAGNALLGYDQVNPVLLREAVAPHIGANDESRPIEFSALHRAYRQVADQVDLVVVEGAGGWQVPLNPTQTFADLVAEAGWPVLLVVGMRLGCLNHALLSAESIAGRTKFAGWVANVLPPRQPRLEENIVALQQRLPGPLLGVIPPEDDAHAVPGPPLRLDTILKRLK
jgi:dethiobiotin synthetase